jgi:hypothetical protein
VTGLNQRAIDRAADSDSAAAPAPSAARGLQLRDQVEVGAVGEPVAEAARCLRGALDHDRPGDRDERLPFVACQQRCLDPTSQPLVDAVADGGQDDLEHLGGVERGAAELRHRLGDRPCLERRDELLDGAPVTLDRLR